MFKMMSRSVAAANKGGEKRDSIIDETEIEIAPAKPKERRSIKKKRK